uniref:Uncharacterized protein n=1 Tax=Candidatus Kentrum eta TaxID=2126337 RepID=A0A450UCK8_9GAMM|nr:MAG: hypothetical protein BECKH772A_GA0070896_1001911 [Candidatus Kentron sp. H]VFJ91397.1 MAG: hypothetical protein BECKH772B_GA0070898_1001711 [Candidatus Kentron sp. H]VFJ98075.1 MAG: hypothetical protein BECKH772C_GA0070978_1001811 [Candidatus Kentron sp. H]
MKGVRCPRGGVAWKQHVKVLLFFSRKVLHSVTSTDKVPTRRLSLPLFQIGVSMGEASTIKKLFMEF